MEADQLGRLRDILQASRLIVSWEKGLFAIISVCFIDDRLEQRSNLWECRHGLFQRFNTYVSIVSAHRLGIVTNKLHDYALRNSGILEQAHGCMAE
jgi:hypothetical protein